MIDHDVMPHTKLRSWRVAARRTLVVVSLCMSLGACKLSTGSCPAPEPIDVALTVLENASGARITRNGTALLIGATSTDTASVVSGRGFFSVPLEREGSFTLRVVALGYDLWQRQNVVIAHLAPCTIVHTVEIESRLTTTASSDQVPALTSAR
ncbi:MAG: hypothetical protein ABIT38_13520 [Gemmatimonadaceae bacterium]